MSEFKLYSKPVILNSIKHREVKVKPIENYKFAKSLNSCVLTCSEFFEACKSYPIVFTKLTDDSIMPAVIFGIKNNNFVGEEGKWREGAYIPAYLRRYPYILAEGTSENKDELAVSIDSAYEGFDVEEGERLFDDEGKNTDFLNRAIEFLKAFHAEYKLTQQFIEKLKSLELFTQVDANIKQPDGSNFTLRNLLVINEEKMLKLDDIELLSLVRIDNKRGFISFIYFHIYSLNNFNSIVQSKE